MKNIFKLITVIAITIIAFSLFTACESTCDHEYGEWEVTKEAKCFDDGSQKRTCAICGNTQTETIPKLMNCGTKLSEFEMSSKASSYVRSKFGYTYGGYKITAYKESSVRKTGETNNEAYAIFTVSGSYTYNGKNSSGVTQSGTKSFTYKVRVYQWSENPENYTTVTGA